MQDTTPPPSPVYKLDSFQAPPSQLPGAWTSLSWQDHAAGLPHWFTITGLDTETIAQRVATDKVDDTVAERTPAVADYQPDVVAAERALAAAEALGVISETLARRRVHALMAAKQEPYAAARTRRRRRQSFRVPRQRLEGSRRDL